MQLTRDFFLKSLTAASKQNIPMETLASAVFDKVLNANQNVAVDLKLHLITVLQQEVSSRKRRVNLLLPFYKRALSTVVSFPR